MKAKAIHTALTAAGAPDTGLHQKTVFVHDMGSACALASLLDPARKKTYAERFQHIAGPVLHEIRMSKEHGVEPQGHGENVGPSHAAFMTYLAMDILDADLDTGIRRQMESDCDFIASNHYASWLESKFAIEAIMELYHHGPSDEFRRRAEVYRQLLVGMSSEDGVYGTGPGYAHSRLYMEDRSQKKMFMDLCEYQGIHDFYSAPRFQHLYEWLFGYSVTPFNRTYTFGDSPPIKSFAEFSSAALRAARFSRRAGAYASWFLGTPSDSALAGGLLQYLSYSGPMEPPAAPVSRIFPNGGAWLLGREYGPQALAGVLWNVSTAHESHAHYDANSVNIAAFGELVLRNSGYDNWQEPDSAGWAWIHRDARSSNTLTIDGRNHVQVKGGGITEGLLGGDVEFARGESGPALGSGTHSRTLAFVHPEGRVPGYFFIVDEVRSESKGARVNLFFHPSSDEPPESGEHRFEFLVKRCNSQESLRAWFCILGAPERITVRDGYVGSMDPCSRFTGKYLDVQFLTDAQCQGRFATVIFPHRAADGVPEIERSADGDALLLRMADGVEDHLVVPAHGTRADVGPVTTSASFAYWREGEGRVRTYLVGNGTRWISRRSAEAGFESSDPVSLIMSGPAGRIVTRGCTITLHFQDVRKAYLDGELCRTARVTSGSIRMEVPPGTHRIRLETGGTGK